MILDLANRQHGVAARHQLIELGLGIGLINGRLSTGALSAVYPGVYAVGHSRLTLQGQWMAGVLAAGGCAALSHRSAGANWGFVRPPRTVEVMRRWGPERSCAKTAFHPTPFGKRLHIRRSRVFGPDEYEIHAGIRTTTVARTLLDLASVLTAEQLDFAYSEAERSGLVRIDEVRDMVRRGRGWTGVGKLRKVLSHWDPSMMLTRSALEMRFLRLCRDHGLPAPDVNVIVGGYEVDCLWREQAVIAELDGSRYHRSPMTIHGDKERTLALEELGYRVMRLSYRMVTEESTKTAERLKSWLK